MDIGDIKGVYGVMGPITLQRLQDEHTKVSPLRYKNEWFQKMDGHTV